jgi:hypothetical protein
MPFMLRMAGHRLLAGVAFAARFLAVRFISGKALATPAPAPAAATAAPPPPPFTVFAGWTGIARRSAFRRSLVDIALRLEFIRLVAVAGTLCRHGRRSAFVAWLVPLILFREAALTVAGAIPLAIPATAPAPTSPPAARPLIVGRRPCGHRLGGLAFGDGGLAAFLGDFLVFILVLDRHFRQGNRDLGFRYGKRRLAAFHPMLGRYKSFVGGDGDAHMMANLDLSSAARLLLRM